MHTHSFVHSCIHAFTHPFSFFLSFMHLFYSRIYSRFHPYRMDQRLRVVIDWVMGYGLRVMNVSGWYAWSHGWVRIRWVCVCRAMSPRPSVPVSPCPRSPPLTRRCACDKPSERTIDMRSCSNGGCSCTLRMNRMSSRKVGSYPARQSPVQSHSFALGSIKRRRLIEPYAWCIRSVGHRWCTSTLCKCGGVYGRLDIGCERRETVSSERRRRRRRRRRLLTDCGGMSGRPPRRPVVIRSAADRLLTPLTPAAPDFRGGGVRCRGGGGGGGDSP